MCKSHRDGGQRCAAHTRPRYLSTPLTHPRWDTVAAEYASTRQGHDHLARQADQAQAGGDYDTEARLRTALRRGRDLRDANRAAAEALRAPVGKSPAIDTGRPDTACLDAPGLPTLSIDPGPGHPGGIPPARALRHILFALEPGTSRTITTDAGTLTVHLTAHRHLLKRDRHTLHVTGPGLDLARTYTGEAAEDTTFYEVSNLIATHLRTLHQPDPAPR